MNATLHQQVVHITEDYLGPAAPRFVDRQIKFHLRKHPDAINTEDLKPLIEWIKVSLALLTDDKKMVDECVDKLNQL